MSMPSFVPLLKVRVIDPDTGIRNLPEPEAAVRVEPRSGVVGLATGVVEGAVFSFGSGLAAEGGIGVGVP